MKKVISIFLSLCVFLSLVSCSLQSQQTYKKDFLDLFDTASSISACDKSQSDFNSNFQLVYNELKTYSQLFDIYNSYGDLVNLKYVNENASVAPVKVDEKIIQLLQYGVDAYEISNQTVNIAMGSVLSLWHQAREYGIENPDTAKLPDSDSLNEAIRHTDISKLVIDEKNSTVYFTDDKLQLDVGAISKGFVCEKITEFIQSNNIWSSAVISLGGNVKTIGTKNNDSKTAFNIAVENPNGDGYFCTLAVDNGKSVVTSGDYQRYYTVDGKNYCHIINPKTLYPAEYFSSVTVICDSSDLADVLSTALFIMPYDDGLKLVESLENVEAVWIDKNNNAKYSSGFEEYKN
jgi:thiamine biosynthesis lipoprotein